MFKISTSFVLFLILALVSPIFASSPCNCESLPSHVGTIIGDLEHLVDEVVSDVIEPVGSAVTSLVDDLLSNLLDLDISNILGAQSNLIDLDGVLGNSGVVGGLLGSDGVVDNVVSAVDDLIDDVLDGEIDISICVGLDLLQNNLFYHFNSGSNNHLVLHGFADITLNVALFTGGCDDLTCVFVDLDFCGSNNDLAIVVEPFTDYYIGVFGAGCDFLIDFDLSCHGTCH